MRNRVVNEDESVSFGVEDAGLKTVSNDLDR